MKKFFLMVPALFMAAACASADPGAEDFTSEQEFSVPEPIPPIIPGDICNLPIDTGECALKEGSSCVSRTRRFGFDPASGQCRMFVYEGKGGNPNNFRTLAQCEARCPAPVVNACEQKIDPGPCKGAFLRWGFDQRAGECRKFIYGGCLGNSNNFSTQAECEAQCEQKTSPCATVLCPAGTVCEEVVCVKAPCDPVCVPKASTETPER